MRVGTAGMSSMRVMSPSAIRRLVYVHPVGLPARTANSVQVMQMAEAFATVGVDVILEAYAGDETTDLSAFYGLPQSFTVNMPEARTRVGLGARVALRAFLRDGRDSTFMTRVASSALVTAWLGARTVLEVHDLPATKTQRFAMRSIARSRAVDLVVCISSALERAIVDTYPGFAGRTMVAHDAAPPDSARLSRVAARQALGLGLDDPVVVYAGSLKRDKGVEVLLDAVTLRSGLTAVIAGGAPEAQLVRLRDAYRDARIRFLGHVRRSDVDAVLAAADVIAAPFVEAANLQRQGRGVTSTAIHGFMSPLKIYEAMAADRPLVASDMPVLREVLTHESNALLVPPGDPEALRAAIDRIVADSALADQLRITASACARDWTWEARARSIASRLLGASDG